MRMERSTFRTPQPTPGRGLRTSDIISGLQRLCLGAVKTLGLQPFWSAFKSLLSRPWAGCRGPDSHSVLALQGLTIWSGKRRVKRQLQGWVT